MRHHRAILLMMLSCFCGAANGSDPYFEWLKQQGGKAPSPAAPPAQPAAAPQPSAASSQSRHAQAVDFGDFVVAYPHTARYGELQAALRQAQMLEAAAGALNEFIALPTNVQLAFEECGVANAFYKPDAQRITICYELLAYYAALLDRMGVTQEQEAAAYSSLLLFVFFHELGHALIDVLDLSFTGREEDAADQLSTYLMISMGGNYESVIYAATAQYIGSSELSEQAYADEHSLGPQRFYNLVCWLYGSGQLDAAASTRVNAYISPTRKAKCPEEFRKLANGWESLLQPNIKE